jgi:hypothetical protein
VCAKSQGLYIFAEINFNCYITLILTLLFRELTEGQSASFARTVGQYSKRNCQYFKKKALQCCNKYFQMVQGLLRSWRLTLQDSAVE